MDAKLLGSVDIDMVEADAARCNIPNPSIVQLAKHVRIQRALVDDDDSLSAIQHVQRRARKRVRGPGHLATGGQFADNAVIRCVLVITEFENLDLHIIHPISGFPCNASTIPDAQWDEPPHHKGSARPSERIFARMLLAPATRNNRPFMGHLRASQGPSVVLYR
jgi:hypothetical protein